MKCGIQRTMQPEFCGRCQVDRAKRCIRAPCYLWGPVGCFHVLTLTITCPHRDSALLIVGPGCPAGLAPRNAVPDLRCAGAVPAGPGSNEIGRVQPGVRPDFGQARPNFGRFRPIWSSNIGPTSTEIGPTSTEIGPLSTKDGTMSAKIGPESSKLSRRPNWARIRPTLTRI